MSKNLKEYNAKRNFTKTKEPIGEKKKSSKKLRFCIQHHEARKEHYDLRLEYAGVLKSWAVPKGPSYNPKDKRLAISVEDHPLSYRNFEGIIPKGEYGGGTVMLWDRGTWESEYNIKDSLKKGLLKFTLKGIRLKGTWALIHTDANHWLLIKEQDGIKEYDTITEFKTSIKTNRTMNEIATNQKVIRIPKINVTSPDKVIFKNPKITKQDIMNYYETIAPRMLPYLKNRLISTIRNPEGLNGPKFFKKHLSENKEGFGKIIIPSSKDIKEDYYYIKNITGLLNEVQMNGYEFHIWGSKTTKLDNPDILVFDLDPDTKLNITKIRESVKDLKSILDDLKLKSYLKTSGGKGYHVVVPLKTKISWEDAREISRNIAKLMERKWPDKYTSNIRKNKRQGKIFIDWVRNTKGSTSVAPYSLRLRKKATISMPISWSELDTIKPDEITIPDALNRLQKKDPWSNFFD